MTKRIHRKRYRRQQGRLVLILTIAVVLLAVWFFRTAHVAAAGDMKSEPYKYYTSITIDQGDSLWSLAEQYNDSSQQDIYSYIEEVKSLNHLTGDSVKAGSCLCIPYYSEEYKV